MRFRSSPILLAAVVLGTTLCTHSGLFAQDPKPANPAPAAPIAHFTDMAQKAGLTMTDVFGGVDTKKYIIETTGTGVAIFDYDNDGWPDIFS